MSTLSGGEVVFCGSPLQMKNTSDTVTAKCLRMSESGRHFTVSELEALVNINDKPEKSETTEEEMKGLQLNPIGRIENDRADSATVPAWCSHWQKNLETSGDFDWKGEFNF